VSASAQLAHGLVLLHSVSDVPAAISAENTRSEPLIGCDDTTPPWRQRGVARYDSFVTAPFPPPPTKLAGWALQLKHLRAAQTFIEACDAERIAVLPVKGIVSGRTLYDDPADRPLTDVDMRVLPRDIARIAKLARRRGWPIAQRMRTYANMIVSVDGADVDVESHVGPRGMCSLRVATLLARAGRSHALGFECTWPDFTDHAVVLIVNAFKDKLVGAFEWAIRDLERIPRQEAYDPALLARRLRASGVGTIGWIVADWMVRVRNVAAWSLVRDAIGIEAPRPRYARRFSSTIERDAHTLAARVLGRMGSDAPSNRASALVWMALWRAEVVLSQLGSAPYRRGHSPPWDVRGS